MFRITEINSILFLCPKISLCSVEISCAEKNTNKQTNRFNEQFCAGYLLRSFSSGHFHMPTYTRVHKAINCRTTTTKLKPNYLCCWCSGGSGAPYGKRNPLTIIITKTANIFVHHLVWVELKAFVCSFIHSIVLLYLLFLKHSVKCLTRTFVFRFPLSYRNLRTKFCRKV